MSEKTKEQLLSELLELQKELEEKVHHHDRMIRRFQTLTANEGLFAQIIDYCPYPIALFARDGILETVNNAFTAETGVKQEDLGNERRGIAQCISDDIALTNALRRVFAGETYFLDDLRNPLIKDFWQERTKQPPSKNYLKAIIFPIPAESGLVMHGAAVFTI